MDVEFKMFYGTVVNSVCVCFKLVEIHLFCNLWFVLVYKTVLIGTCDYIC